MSRLLNQWNALDLRRRAILVISVVAVTATFSAILRLAAQPSMSLLYAGLEPPQAGEVVAALDARGAQYSIRGDAIHVPARDRDGLRLALAAEGLPQTGGQGYEILDSLSGFSTTSQMFDAAHRRALEGELARTIAASPRYGAARVHLAVPNRAPFAAPGTASASVTVTSTAGQITPQQAEALGYLVSSAVAGMEPASVSVIDGGTGLVVGARDGTAGEAAHDRERQLKENVERLLEARVGPGAAVVELSIERVLDEEQIVERVIDPDSRVAISIDTEERAARSNDARNNSVTVASELPDGDAGNAGARSSDDSETRERVNYEVSETRREILRRGGDIRRVTVAVLVDGEHGTDAAGDPTWTPRSADEIAALRDLVASAVGFDAGRGDVITIESMRFEPLPTGGTAISAARFQLLPIDPMRIVQIGVLGFVTLALGLFVLRPILTAAPLPVAAARELPPPPAGPVDMPASPPELLQPGDLPGNLPVVSTAGLPAAHRRGDAESPVSELRALIGERETESVEVLRSWVDEAGARA